MGEGQVVLEIICPRVLRRVVGETVMLVDTLLIDTGVMLGEVVCPCLLVSWDVLNDKCPRVMEAGKSGDLVITAILENLSSVEQYNFKKETDNQEHNI